MEPVPDVEASISQAFAETFAEGVGIPGAAGRLFAALMLSDVPLTQADLRESLSLSEGSVSEGLRLLVRDGLAERAGDPRARPAHFHLRDDAWAGCAKHTVEIAHAMHSVAVTTLAALDADGGRHAAARRRAEGMRLMYESLLEDLPAVLERAVKAAETASDPTPGARRGPATKRANLKKK